MIEFDVPTTAAPLLPGNGSVVTGIAYSSYLALFLMVILLCLVQAQVHAPDLRKRVRVDSWSTESESGAKPPTPKRAKVHQQPGPPVTHHARRSRNLSSSSVLSVTDSHGSVPSVDSGLGRSFDVHGATATPPRVIQVCSVCCMFILWLVLISVVF